MVGPSRRWPFARPRPAAGDPENSSAGRPLTLLEHRMPRYLWALLLIGCLLSGPSRVARADDKLSDSPQLVAPTEAISAAEQQKKFRLPPGFSIQLVAAEPEIRKPMNLNFDVHGRLYATQSEEYPFPAKGECAAARRGEVALTDRCRRPAPAGSSRSSKG